MSRSVQGFLSSLSIVKGNRQPHTKKRQTIGDDLNAKAPLNGIVIGHNRSIIDDGQPSHLAQAS